MGNLRSVTKALEHIAPSQTITLTSDANTIARADRVVFPGQGAMRDCVRELDQRGLRQAVLDAARNKPFLGICVGAQLLFNHSEEGDSTALGILPGNVVRFPAKQMHNVASEKLKVPHMGWNQVRQINPHGKVHPLWQGIADNERFYFVHSYYMQPTNTALTTGESDYPFPFSVAVARQNIFAVQFHPEKSHAAGLQMLRNFVSWDGAV